MNPAWWVRVVHTRQPSPLAHKFENLPGYNLAMFTLLKIGLSAIDPGTILLAALLIGAVLLWTRWRGLGRRVVSVTALMILLIATMPLENWIIRPLENRFPQVNQLPERISGIITLGGGTERLFEFIALARRHPEAKLVFSGGAGRLFVREKVNEADAARMFFERMGLDVTRVIFENKSRNTYENAVLSYALVKPKTGEQWVLITSAVHMPRAVGVFRKVGWPVIPYPTNYATEESANIMPRLNLVGGLSSISIGIREWMGLPVYRLLHRTDSLFPAPEN